MSLRFKGAISLVAIILYVGVMTVMVTDERLKLPTMVRDLERVHRLEEQMVQVNMQVARTISAAGESYYATSSDAGMKQLFLELAPLDGMLASLSRHYSPLRRHHDRLKLLAKELAHQPSKPALGEVRTVLHSLVFDFDQLTQGLRSEKEKLLAGYQLVHDKITLETFFFLFLGVVLVGAIMTIFFARLTWDIRRVGLRAMAIVKGYRGRPLELTRGDEVGDLMQAVNQMQFELRDRERQLELGRQQQFHQDKMAAVGALAAAVAHEINNPIMAISGLAQMMADRRKEGLPFLEKEPDGLPEMILEQATRISLITRKISEFSAPQSAEAQLTDLNSLVRNTAEFVRFDQRYRRLELKVDTDRQLPAVTIVADHLTQILINLLVNAADSFEGLDERKAEVRLTTRYADGAIEIAVSDNGAGMSAETLQHACEEFFTTKARGKGTGLGLFLTKTLIEEAGGSLRLESEPGIGTTAILRLPVAVTAE